MFGVGTGSLRSVSLTGSGAGGDGAGSAIRRPQKP